jgi:PAS domain S-box-containing protein
MSLNPFELQLSSAIQRFHMLQRSGDREPGGSKLLPRALDELERALEELRVAQDQLVENRSRLEGMQAELTRQYEKYWQLFDEMPQAYVVTKPDTTITEANLAAAELLNVSQRFLAGKTLSVFVCEDRSGFLQAAARAAGEREPTEMTLRIRPRERATIGISATIRGGETLRWVLSRRVGD